MICDEKCHESRQTPADRSASTGLGLKGTWSSRFRRLVHSLGRFLYRCSFSRGYLKAEMLSKLLVDTRGDTSEKK